MSSKRKSNKVTDKQTVESTPVQVVVAPTKVTNADKVRGQIELQMDAGSDYAAGKKTVVDWAVQELQMKRPLARRYVKENWERVTRARAKVALAVAQEAGALR